MGGCIPLDQPSTQTEFGDLVGISQQAVSELQTSGLWKSQVTTIENVRAYCAKLREEAAGRDTELARERARLAREQADGIALKNAAQRREYAPVVMLEQALATACRQIVGVLETLPRQLRAKCAHLTSADIAIVEAEIVKVRNYAAATKLSWEDATEEASPNEV